MYARVSNIQTKPQGVESSIRYFDSVTLPEVRSLPGYMGATLLVDRETGFIRVLTYWDSRETLDASAEAANRLRSAYIDQAEQASLISVEALEVAVDEYEAKIG